MNVVGQSVGDGSRKHDGKDKGVGRAQGSPQLLLGVTANERQVESAVVVRGRRESSVCAHKGTNLKENRYLGAQSSLGLDSGGLSVTTLDEASSVSVSPPPSVSTAGSGHTHSMQRLSTFHPKVRIISLTFP